MANDVELFVFVLDSFEEDYANIRILKTREKRKIVNRKCTMYITRVVLRFGRL